MQKEEIIIIGAGASGMMAARELVKAGYKVVILEGRNRIGGRIQTLVNNEFSTPVEAGAEFIHGALPVTLQLLKEAGIGITSMKGATWQVRNGKLSAEETFFTDWHLLESTLHSLKEDMTIADFITLYFNEEKYAALSAAIRGFAEGYDAADTNRASTFALRDEWLNEEESTNYRVNGGYGKMIQFLEEECVKKGALIQLNAVAKEIQWDQNSVTVICNNGRQFTGTKIIITVPLGVLQQGSSGESALSFVPPLPEKSAAIANMGFGSVIKVLIEFTEPFWKSKQVTKHFGKNADDLGFLISDAAIPTWWTQHPQQHALLTGWLAGPSSQKWKDTSDAMILGEALDSLAAIFPFSKNELKEKIVASRVINWNGDPFALGAYAYATLATNHSIEILNDAAANTIFFAGEAFYAGPAMGTVEAALTSGANVSKRILEIDRKLQ
ncbi:MAG TPA: NAD(P)/FAD-dependent oxidoreductase [Chitinophagales bacterium]|nr:NAD(P)/FAD-dependent oxidoreductase [Chitinophagales bacterium]